MNTSKDLKINSIFEIILLSILAAYDP